jgi:hypothetical protein
MSICDESEIETLDGLVEHRNTSEIDETQDILTNDFVLINNKENQTPVCWTSR